ARADNLLAGRLILVVHRRAATAIRALHLLAGGVADLALALAGEHHAAAASIAKHAAAVKAKFVGMFHGLHSAVVKADFLDAGLGRAAGIVILAGGVGAAVAAHRAAGV